MKEEQSSSPDQNGLRLSSSPRFLFEGQEREAPPIPDHQLLRRIGSGSYGDVWLARNVMGTYRAVKVIYRNAFEEQRPYDREFEGIKRFEPISRLDETQIDILHVGRNDQAGYFYYVMELADDASLVREEVGGFSNSSDSVHPETYVPRTLKSELKRRGRISCAESVQVGLGLTQALDHLHTNGLVHRDVKPSNIIFVNGKPKLADLGLVACLDATVSFVGTAGYVPPEGPGAPQADIYSLGKVLYELTTGQDRFEFPHLPGELADGTASKELLELNVVLLKACQVDPGRRYQTAREMNTDLRLLESGKSVMRLRLLEKRIRVGRRIIVGLMALAIIGGTLAYQTKRAEQRSRRLSSAVLVKSGSELMAEGALFQAMVDFSEAFQLDQGDTARERRHRLRLASILRHCPKPVGIFHHGGKPAVDAALSPDGSKVVTIGQDEIALVWDVASGDLVHVLRHEQNLLQVAYSPDGLWIATTTDNSTAHLWESATGRKILTDLPHFSGIGAFMFYDLVKGTDRIYLNKSLAGLVLDEPLPLKHERVKLVLSFTGQGQDLILSSKILDADKQDQELWAGSFTDTPGADSVAWEPERWPGNALGEAGQLFLGLTKDPGNSSLAQAAFDDLRVRVYDDTGTQRDELLDDFDGGTLNGWYIGQRGSPGAMMSETNGCLTLTAPPPRQVYSIAAAFSRELFPLRAGQTVEFTVTLLRASHCRVYLGLSLPTGGDFLGDRQSARLRLHRTAPQFSPDSRLLLTRLAQQAQVLSVPDGQPLGNASVNGPQLEEATFSSRGSFVLVRAGSEVTGWDPTTGQVLFGPHESLDRKAESCVDPEEKHLVVVADKQLQLRTLQGALIWAVPLDTPPGFYRFSFSPDGSRLIGDAWESSPRLWDVATGARLPLELPHPFPVLVAGFSPDGQRIVTVTEDHLAYLWDGWTGELLGPPLPHSPQAGLPEFGPNGRLLLTVNPGLGAWLWDLSRLDPIEVTIPPIARTRTTADSPAGDLRATLQSDHSVVLSRVPSGDVLSRLTALRPLRQAVFGVEGRCLLTQTRDTTAQAWDVGSAEPLTPMLKPTYGVSSFQFASIDLPQDDRLAQRWLEIAQLLAGREFDRPLGLAELTNLWSRLRVKEPATFGLGSGTNRNWHEEQALICEQSWNWFGARYHLSRLSRSHPKQAHWQTRLAYAEEAMLRRREAGRLNAIPPRSLGATEAMLDLSAFYNLSIKDDLSGEIGTDSLANLPCGNQDLGGTRFDIRGVVRCFAAPSGATNRLIIPVSRTCRQILFLHATQSMGNSHPRKVAEYVVHFADGAPEFVPLTYHNDILEVVTRSGGPLASPSIRLPGSKVDSVLAWVGTNPTAQFLDRSLRLTKSTWTNPRSDQCVTHLEVRAILAEHLLIAVTLD